MRVGNAIYMDYQATTPLDPAAREAMLPYMDTKFGNPHSSSHRFGWEADAGVEAARVKIGGLLHVSPDHVIFTSGATESNNLAIKGVGHARLAHPGRVITLDTEHTCVVESAKSLASYGHDVHVLPVQQNGLLDLNQLEEAITPDTFLISVMLVNNEIGVIQPLDAISKIAREKGVLLHCDAAQAIGKMPVNGLADACDLISLSAHKLYGPKGIGALYVNPEVRHKMVPHMHGGGQEAELRSGTLAPALSVGFGAAASRASEELAVETLRAARHFDMLLKGIEGLGYAIHINGDIDQRLKSNLNISFEGIDGARLMSHLRRLAVSSGAACASAKEGPSYVLDAIGVPRELAQATLRIGTGRFTDDSQIEDALGHLEAALKKSIKRKWSA